MRIPGITGPLTSLIPAAFGGAAWEWTGMPLGWLMGAALVTGGLAVSGQAVLVPRRPIKLSLAAIGCSVGLAITPEVAGQILTWAPVMVLSASAGIACAAIAAPVLARFGRISRSTSFFALLPGGVIEMANIGDRFGADRTAIAALHAVRVALVVGLLPLAFALALPHGADVAPVPHTLEALPLLAALAIAVGGGWVGDRLRFPAAWLLGAVIAVGVVTGAGAFDGDLPAPMLAVAQVFVGISLGARFTRESMAAIPRILATGTPVLLAIMAAMASLAWLAAQVMPHALATLVLCFAIGGMAEMVLTARTFDQDIALVAAFQAIRGVIVNLLAGPIWARLSTYPAYTDT